MRPHHARVAELGLEHGSPASLPRAPGRTGDCLPREPEQNFSQTGTPYSTSPYPSPSPRAGPKGSSCECLQNTKLSK